ncbi:MAG TPA: hypothetical protein VL947_01720, partial [Cytophagales bacterium]|nr:hypothetical protein [Cytophagales bacterium]
MNYNTSILRAGTRLMSLCFCLSISSNIVAQAYRWGSVAIGGGGFVSAIVTSKSQPNTMYARTDVGGAYRWDATTASWIPLNDWASQDETGYLGVESIAIDPKT